MYWSSWVSARWQKLFTRQKILVITVWVFEHYCHFTSPIRRYPDVLVHRILQECLDKNLKPDKKMDEKCKHCSDRERKAMEAERAGNKYKQVEFYAELPG